jgi:hypothetical protein
MARSVMRDGDRLERALGRGFASMPIPPMANGSSPLKCAGQSDQVVLPLLASNDRPAAGHISTQQGLSDGSTCRRSGSGHRLSCSIIRSKAGLSQTTFFDRYGGDVAMNRTLGVCYYPEHWPEAQWVEDAARMASLGIVYVRIGEFAWSRLEPQTRRTYEFGLARAMPWMSCIRRRSESGSRAHRQQRRRNGWWMKCRTCCRWERTDSMPGNSAHAGIMTFPMTATSKSASGSPLRWPRPLVQHPGICRMADRQ